MQSTSFNPKLIVACHRPPVTRQELSHTVVAETEVPKRQTNVGTLGEISRL